jgi:peroxiredoxin (alkyl hydroperoxide reductase subunit C)
MLGVGDKIPEFQVVGAKAGFTQHEQNGESAFADITQDSFEGKWKVLFFWPKDFTFVCPTEIVEYGNLNAEFDDRDAVLLGCSTDNEFCHLAWRREHKDLTDSPFMWLSDTNGNLVDGLGIRERDAGVALRATFIIDPHGVIQHVTVNNLNVGRSPSEALRILDGLQTDELCPCNRPVGGETL